MTAEENYHIGLLNYCVRKRWIRKIHQYGLNEDDAFSMGLVGLTIALQTYKESQTCTFAHHAIQYIWNSIFAKNRHRFDIERELKKLKEIYFQKTGRELMDEQIAKLLDTSVKILKDHQRETMCFEYAVAYCGDDFGEREQIYINKDDPLPEVAGSLDKEFFNEAVMQEVNLLPELSRKVIKLYFGLDGLESCSLREIHKILTPCTQFEIKKSWEQGLEKLSANNRLRELHLAEV